MAVYPGTMLADYATPVSIEIPPFGYVRLMETMGSDASIIESARVSYRNKTGKPLPKRPDRILNTYLLRKDHSSPFEQAEMKWEIHAPIFVARQLVRTRTANWNEVSLRYTEADDEEGHIIQWAPEAADVRGQGNNANKQVGDGILTDDKRAAAAEIFQDAGRTSEAYYKELRQLGVSKELARAVLPVQLYTTWHFKIDLNNLMKLLWKRTDPSAQPETRAVCEAMVKHFATCYPETYASWLNVYKHGERLTGKQVAALKNIISNKVFNSGAAFNALENVVRRHCHDENGALSSEGKELMALFFAGDS